MFGTGLFLFQLSFLFIAVSFCIVWWCGLCVPIHLVFLILGGCRSVFLFYVHQCWSPLWGAGLSDANVVDACLRFFLGGEEVWSFFPSYVHAFLLGLPLWPPCLVTRNHGEKTIGFEMPNSCRHGCDLNQGPDGPVAAYRKLKIS